MAGNRPMIFEILGDASNVTEVMDTFQRHAGVVAAGAAAAFAGAKIGGAIAANLDADVTLSKLEAQLGGVGAKSQAAGEAASALFRSGFGEGLDETAEAVRSVGEQMVDLGSVSTEELEKITGGALIVAQTFDKDVSEVTRAAGQLMKNGLAPDAQTALDIIGKGFTEGLDASGDFLDVLMEYSEPMAALGLDGQTALAMFKDGLDSGAFTLDKVGDAMNEFATLAVEEGGTAAEAFTALGFDAEAMTAKIAAGGPGAKDAFSQVIQALGSTSDEVAQNAAGVALFGGVWEDAGKAMVLSMDPMIGAMTDVDGAVTSMGETLNDNATSKVEGWRRSVDGAIQDMIGLPGPVGTGAAAISAFGGDALALGSTLGMTVVAIQGMNFSAMASSVATRAAAIGTGVATAAQWLWNAALAANPIMLVVLAIAALVAGFVWAWQNVDSFKNAMLAAWDWIKMAWGETTQFFTNVGNAIWGGIKVALDWLGTNWPTILAILTGPIGWAVLAITQNWDSIKAAFSAGFEAVKGFMSQVGDAIYAVWSWTPLGLIVTNWDSITSFFGKVPGYLKTAFSTVTDILFAPFKAGFNAIATAWNNTLGKMSFSAPDWVPGIGGKGFSIPKIPMLAAGGIATRATLAMIGEGAGPEAIVPLDRIGDFLNNANRPGTSTNAGTRTWHVENLHTGATAAELLEAIAWEERTSPL